MAAAGWTDYQRAGLGSWSCMRRFWLEKDDKPFGLCRKTHIVCIWICGHFCSVFDRQRMQEVENTPRTAVEERGLDRRLSDEDNMMFWVVELAEPQVDP